MTENDQTTMPTLDIIWSTWSSLAENVAPRDVALTIVGGLVVNFLWSLPAYFGRRSKKVLAAHDVIHIPIGPTYLGGLPVRVEFRGHIYDRILFNSYLLFNGTDTVITDASFIKNPHIEIANDNQVIFKELVEASGSGSGVLTVTDGQLVISSILLRPNEYLALTVATSSPLDMLEAIMPNQASLHRFEPGQIPRPLQYGLLILVAALFASAAFNSLTGLLSSALSLAIIWWFSVRNTPKKRIEKFFWALSNYGTFHPRADTTDGEFRKRAAGQ